jgi:hypothetical protein
LKIGVDSAIFLWYIADSTAIAIGREEARHG